MRRAGLLVLILAALASPSLASAADAPARANRPEIEDEVMCPVCGTLLGLSHSPAAERQRVFIRRLIDEGKTKEEIKDALVAEYGGQVLGLPENRGIDVWAYAVPVAGFILAIFAVLWGIFSLRRRRRREEDSPPEAGPDQEDSDRLERDMARFDL